MTTFARLVPVAFAAALGFAALPVVAAPQTYLFDKTHTEVRFCWKHLGMSTQCAHFLEFDGELAFDASNPEASKLNIVFQTDSIHTRVAKFDDHMKSADLFEVAKYPQITFVATKLEKTGEKTGRMTGDLTVKGVTKPVTLDVTMNFTGDHPMRKTPALGFSAKGSLKRSDFNVAYAVPAVSDEIDITIETELVAK
jgi:polyisoprenoid-binding protein YceI